jgi:hypothetical protein
MVWVSTEVLCLRRLTANRESPDEAISGIPTPLLRHLRHLTRQASIPRRVCIAFQSECGAYDKDLPEFGPDATTLGFMTRDYLVDTRLTVEHLRRLAALPRDCVTPIHEELLLDALEAQIEDDHRKAILYAAVAMESAATLSLEKEYQRVCQLGATDQSYRITSTQVTATSTTIADPIYEALSERTGVRHLLHECPLYLSKRSLLLDDPSTYQKAIALYAARNNLAHGNAPSKTTDYSPPSADAAVRALDVAIEVMRWLGFDGGYSVWRSMVTVDGATK